MSMTSPPEDFFAYILKSIPSGSDFQTHSPLIFSWLSHGSKSFADKLLKDILVILEDAQYPPTSKFYSVLLLLKGTEISNGLLASRLAKQRHLLDKIFKDAQFDKQKEFEQRGRKFFSRNPTEEQAVLGVNYVRLVLEAIVYWYQMFGIGNTRDPLYIFTLMYNNLSTLLTLPQVFYYAAREFTVSDGFHLKHFLTLTDDPVCLENSSKKSIEEAEEELDRDQIFNDVVACISSIADFKTNSPLVFQEVTKNSWTYNKVLLQTLNSILTGSGYPPEFKFYALLLAVKLSETKNEIFIQHLGEERTFLESVLKNSQFEKDKAASERGKTFFKANPSPKEAIAGNNFVMLSREAIHFWAAFAEILSQKACKEGVLRLKSLCSDLAIKLELKGDYAFIGNPLTDDADPFLRKCSEEATTKGRKEEKTEKQVSKQNTPSGVTTRRDNAQKYARRAEEHLKACIVSDEGYKEGSLVIQNALRQNVEEYSKALLATIENILNSDEKTYRQKYYTVFSLVEMTKDEGQRGLLKQVEEAQSLLETLFVHAEDGLERLRVKQKKDNNAGSQAPQEMEDDVHMCAYGRLVCEAIIWWNRICGNGTKNKFQMMYEALNQNNKGLPQDFIFVQEGKTGVTPQEALDRFSEYRMQKQEEEEKMLIEELKVKLERLADVKGRFKKALEENEGAIFRNMRIVDSMMKEFTQVYHKEVLLNANLLIDNNIRGSEKFVQRAVLEGDIFEKVSRAYLDYKQQILKYHWFRAEVIKIFSDPELDVSMETSQGVVEMSRVEAQEALGKIMVGKERVEEVILASEKASVVMQQQRSSEENSEEKHQRTPGHMIIGKDGEEDIQQSAWVYMSGEGNTSSKREISSILNADEDKSTPKKKIPIDSPASPSHAENSDYISNVSPKREVSNWASKVNNTEASGRRRRRLNNRTETSSEQRSETEDQEEEESNVISYSAYEAIVNENRKLREENRELYKENSYMKKHIAENKEQAKLEEASQALEGMRGILLEAQVEMEELYRELHKKSEEHKYYKRRCEKLEQEIRYYRENAELRGKLDGLSLDMHELKRCMIEKSANVTKNENEELLKRLKELENKNGSLTKILEDIQEKNSVMSSKMQELEELQTIATTYRQNTSRLVGMEKDFGLESKTARNKENVLESEEVVTIKQNNQENEEKELETNSKGISCSFVMRMAKGLEVVGDNMNIAQENQNQNQNQNENYNYSTPRESPSNKKETVNQSPLRLVSDNIIQNKNQDGKNSLQNSPYEKDLENKGMMNQSEFSFPKRYYSLQISKCFLPENNEEHDLSSLSVDVKNCIPQNSHGLNIEGLGLNIENKNQP